MTVNNNIDLSIYFSFQVALNNGSTFAEALVNTLELMQDYHLTDTEIADKVNELTGGHNNV